MQCAGCSKFYSNKANLKKHWARQPLCEEWIKLEENGLKRYVEEEQDKPLASVETGGKLRCQVCHTVFANVGNLNRHRETNTVCKKWETYQNLSPILPYVSSSGKGNNCDTFTSKLTLEHYWNVYFTESKLVVDECLFATCNDYNIVYVLVLLPTGEVQKMKVDSERKVLAYEGYHAKFSVTEFDEELEKIKAFEKENRSVLIFCSTGYQRLLPFLCYYVLKRGNNVYSSVKDAVSNILRYFNPNLTKDPELVQTNVKYVENTFAEYGISF